MHPERPYLQGFNSEMSPSPCYIVDLGALRRNAEILKHVADTSGAKVLLALKGFSLSATFPMLRDYLSGVCASSPHEAQLGREKFSGAGEAHEVHTFSPAFSEADFETCLKLSDHMVLNSFAQYERYGQRIRSAGKELGLRVNPKYSEGEVDLYDPCAEGSRLGIPIEQFKAHSLEKDGELLIDGLHMHTLCEQGSDVLERTVAVLEAKLAPLLHKVKWLNLGGGHHITQPDYDIERLIKLLKRLRDQYGVQVYLEPGEAVAINTGAMVTTVLETQRNGNMDIAILDTSVTCHLPDVLEMPYRASILGAGMPQEKKYTFRLGGQSCLAGDVLGDYSFDEPLKVGQRLFLEDMSHYTMVKTTTFNGIGLPSIALWDAEENKLEVTKTFDYEDFASRLS
jgi:carboxynorspermidine decarboxylase